MPFLVYFVVLKANEEVDDDAELRELERRDPTVVNTFDLVRDG